MDAALQAELSRFASAREQTLAMTAGLFFVHPKLDYRGMIYEHPLIGTNTVPELIRFAALHEQRHQDQIREALAS